MGLQIRYSVLGGLKTGGGGRMKQTKMSEYG
jgi:hypothetical protein